jgi:hypothetical protein
LCLRTGWRRMALSAGSSPPRERKYRA